MEILDVEELECTVCAITIGWVHESESSRDAVCDDCAEDHVIKCESCAKTIGEAIDDTPRPSYCPTCSNMAAFIECRCGRRIMFIDSMDDEINLARLGWLVLCPSCKKDVDLNEERCNHG